MDMPAIVSEYFPGINMQQVNEAVEKYQPAWQIISHTWGHETLQEIMQGQVSVPDEVINQAIAENLGQDGPVQSVKLKSKANGRLEILAKTKKAGRVEFSGTIEDFVHNSQESHVTYKVKERALKDHGLASWFFSRMSLSMAQKLFGKVDLGESLPTNIHAIPLLWIVKVLWISQSWPRQLLKSTGYWIWWKSKVPYLMMGI